MRYPLSLVALTATAFAAFAQSPPDPFNEPIPLDMGYWENPGQLTDPEGNQTFEAAFYSEGCYPVGFPANGSRVSYTVSQSSNDSLVPDTLLRWDVKFIGDGVQQVNPVGSAPHADYRNFYFPHCGEQGITNVRRFERVVYSGIYPGIDLHLYQGAGGQKLALVCHPGSAPASIRMLFEGASGLSIAADGGLRFPVLSQVITLPHPLAYQYEGTNVLNLPQENFGFVLEGNEVHFNLGGYDPALPLVLFIGHEAKEATAQSGNTGLCWSTYFGGEKDDWIRASTLDSKSSYFIAGQTVSAFPYFPSTGIAAITPGNYWNAFAAKFNNEDYLMWTTIIGGGGNTQTYASSIAVASSANNNGVYVGGLTNSSNFPVYQSGIAYFDGNGVSGNQGTIIRLDNMTGAQTWTTYFGGSGTRIHALEFLGGNRLIVTGDITSVLPTPQVAAPPGATVFPYGGGVDAFVALFNGVDQLRWITHYGGSGSESGRSIKAYGKSFYVLGTTMSTNLPIVNKMGAYNDGSFNGVKDVFIMLFNPDAACQWTTYFGGSLTEELFYPQNMHINPVTGDLYIVGSTYGSALGFPLKFGGLGSYNSSGPTYSTNGFIARFHGSTQGLLWSTLFGNGYGGRMAVTVNKQGDVFTCGQIAGSHMPITPPQPFVYDQPLVNWNAGQYGLVEQDCYVARFRMDNSLDWCTYFGGKAGTASEAMNTLVYKDYWLYGAGSTSKYQDPNSYFPLVPPYDPQAYYDPIWNQHPLPDGMDAYIVKFCPSPMPRPAEALSHPTGMAHGELRVTNIGFGQYSLQGIASTSTVQLFNSMGQLVRSVRPMGGTNGAMIIDVHALSSGVYTLYVAGAGGVRICVVP